ncbi:putative thiol precursor dipeptidase [Corynebacterium renale]|uniref:Acetylornithine deacetylase/succinyl-diaminopimelate desuccinylase-like protein n=1 Tax=Corynebacterium renale TaxID=1724 RepID=A0A2A9DMP7_9CORY|nr:dipeptidase [Corynebacterium renale]PFG27978.1 acetylornithine deacetylase/succinyl-diaminopimelate desuccinylase-like protein [Corynebacterium renale]SQG63299.1 putative thiol precursor dipeptidase [Corynebacterium renale]SQI21498.1 putative thiol precursor dipeptidase [Corynebacterium renale]STC99412.1 putative thiol precursor dipeptidase [Corynebacterium renale]
MSTQRELIFQQLKEIVSFNSVHGDPALTEACAGAAVWTENALRELPIAFDVTAIPTVDGSTAVLAHRDADEGQPTVLLYCHHDVVHAGDPAAWESDPFTLTERNGRWYGRGAADCKGNLVMHLAALRDFAETEDPAAPKIGLTVLVEGSEEQGGEGLDTLIETRPELFAAEAILIADTGNAAVGTPTLTTSLRGGAQLGVTVRTLEGAVHSGMFGGAAPDAVAALVRTLDSLRDEHGRTVIDGVDTTATWDGAPYDAETFRTDAGVLEDVDVMGDGENPSDLVWARPAVTVTGFTSTPVAEAVNAVPAIAQAQLNLRVPAGMDAATTAEALKKHLENHVPWGAHIEVTIEDINDGFATDVTKPALKLLGQALSEAYDGKDIVTVGSGGSIPLTLKLQNEYPDAEIALFGVEEPQTVIHSANESVDPTEIERIAAAETQFLLNYGK